MSRRKKLLYFSLILILFLVFLNVFAMKFSLIKRMFFQRSYIFIVLFNLNFLLFFFLLYLIGKNVLRAFVEGRLRSGRFRTKLLLSLLFVSVVPSIVVFVISAVFLVRSLNYWFPVEGEKTLKGALTIAQSYHNYMVKMVKVKSVKLKKLVVLKGGPLSVTGRDLERWRVREDLDALCLVNRKGVILGLSLPKELKGKLKLPKVPEPKGLKIILSKNAEWIWKVDYVGRGIYLLSGLYIPQNLSRWIEEISDSYLSYTQLKKIKRPLKNTYILTLLIMTLLVVLASVWLSYRLSRLMVEPVEMLTSSADKVGHGDFSVKVEVPEGRDDEVGRLISTFNWMVEELRKGRERIERDKNFIETILQNVPAGIVVFDVGMTVLMANRYAGEIFGVDPSEYVGKGLDEIVPEKYLSQIRDTFGAVMLGRQVREKFEFEVGGRVVNILVTLTPVRGESGDVSLIVGVLEDVTESLTVQRLLAWKEAARRIAHEIKNPLTPIKMSAERIRRRYLSGDGMSREDLDNATRIIVDEVENIRKLVQDFSQMARFPSLNLEVGDLAETVRSSVENYSGTYSDVEFHLDVSSPILVSHDRNQMRRVFFNLIKNAVEAMEGVPDKRVDIKVFRDGSRAVVEIKDRGKGMDEGMVSRIFDPYFSTKEKGRGLGLTVVSTIVAEHRGRVYVKGTSPEGTTLVLELPCHEG